MRAVEKRNFLPQASETIWDAVLLFNFGGADLRGQTNVRAQKKKSLGILPAALPHLGISLQCVPSDERLGVAALKPQESNFTFEDAFVVQK